MTATTTSAELVADIECLRSDLAKVSATINIFGEPAFAKAVEIDASIKDASERLATILADEAIAARDKRLHRFSDIRVEVHPGESLIDTGFTIRYTQDAWDMSINATVPKAHTCNGFAALADDAYEYLVTKKPGAIPSEIMALSPDKPQEAFAIYLRGKARGFFKG